MSRKNNILTIIKKEFARFFGDRRMVVTTILLPGIMIYLLYSFMGNAMSTMFTSDEDYVPQVYVVNLPESVSAMLAETNFEITKITTSKDVENAQTAITDKELDLLAVFPEDFDAAVAAYDISKVEVYDSLQASLAPHVELYYNATDTESNAAFQTLYAMLDAYESALANKFDINSGDGVYNLASDRDASGFVFSSMLPMLMMIFLFQGCMGVAPESIAGEKERGTIATMLITPAKRSELAIGKIVALAFIALLSGISSATGTILSLPKMMGFAEGELGGVFYTVSDYLMLGAVVLSTVLLFISLISIISAYAKTVKEAATAVMPLMIVAMLVGVSAMFSGGAKDGVVYYLIPAYNSVQAMVGIFSFSVNYTNVLVTVIANLVISAVGGFVLTKMFNSEKCMFNK